MNKSQKKLFTLYISCMVLIASFVGQAYSYFSANLSYTNKTNTVLTSATLSLKFDGQSEVINCSNIIPGDKCIKEFDVENESYVETYFNLYMEKITNEFGPDLTYEIEENGEMFKYETVLPKTNNGKTYLETNITIPARTTKHYKLTITYNYLEDIDQSNTQGYSFKATVGIDTAQGIYASNCTATTGTGRNAGDIMQCGDNEFVVLENNSEHLLLMSRYNLDVTNNYADSEQYKTIAFDEANYREDDYCTTPAYGCNVYERSETVITNSSIKAHVDNFKEKLLANGSITNKDDVRLISLDELDDLGCSSGDRTAPISCPSAPSYLTNTSYWTINSNDSNINDVWVMIEGGRLSYDMAAESSYYNLRPIVEVKKSKTLANKVDLDVSATWIWQESMESLNVSNAKRTESVNKLIANNINKVYLSIQPADLDDYTDYIKKLNQNNIEVYGLYGDPHYVIEENIYNAIHRYVDGIDTFNNNHNDAHIDGIHYDIEYYAIHDTDNNCAVGQSENAKNCWMRKNYVKFVRQAKPYAESKNLKIGYDTTPWFSNFATFYDEDDNNIEKNVLDELIANSDEIVSMSYGNKPRYSLNGIYAKHAEFEDTTSLTVNKSYAEKLNDAGMTIIVGQEFRQFYDAYNETKDNIVLKNTLFPEYKALDKNLYTYNKAFIFSMFDEIAMNLHNKGYNKIGLAYHDYRELLSLQ